MDSIAIGIAWCVAWGDRREPQFAIGDRATQIPSVKGSRPLCSTCGILLFVQIPSILTFYNHFLPQIPR